MSVAQENFEEIYKAHTKSLFSELEQLSKSVRDGTISDEDTQVFIEELEALRKEARNWSQQALTYNATAKKKIAVEKDIQFVNSMYTRTKSQLLTTQSKKQGPAATAQQLGVELPKIQIQPFSGDISKFQDFISLFDGLVHNNTNLTQVQKFYYLKTYLTGEAKQTIDNFLLEENNYEAAYQAFLNIYSSKRTHAFYYLNNIDRFRSSKQFSFKEFLLVHRNSYQGLRNLKITDLAEFILFYLSYNNLPMFVKREFDKKCMGDIPTLEKFFEFLEVQARVEELQNLQIKNTKLCHATTESGSNKCLACKGNHKLFNCKDFLNLEPKGRINFVKLNKLCINCLKSHDVTKCKTDSTCKKCHLRHNTLLHFTPQTQKSPNQLENTPNSAQGFAGNCRNDDVVLLGTLMGYVQDKFGKFQRVRCLLDQGSQLNLITKKAANRLGLNYELSRTGNVKGINNTTTLSAGKVRFNMHGPISNHEKVSIDIEAIVIQKVTDDLPKQRIPSSIYKKVQHLPLADKYFSFPGEIDILLGVQTCNQILLPEFHFGEPSRIKTKFGWVIQGKCANIPSKISNPTLHCFLNTNIKNDLERLWEMDDFPELCVKSAEHEFCENHFRDTVQRTDTGRFSVSFPFKQEPVNLDSNRAVAIKSYHKLEQRLARNSSSLTAYHDFMKNLIEQNYMEEATSVEPYILPQHCVYKDSTTTKCRVVFNASHKSFQGKSLNEQMFIGPPLLKDVVEILFHFRLKPVTLCADIKQCYLQIEVNKQHRKYQHIFYRPSPQHELKEYEVTRLLFGTSAAPYLCQRVLQQLIQEEAHSFPEAAEALRTSLYLDDFVGGSETVEKAIKLQKDLTQLLQRGGFHLRKFTSSHPEVIQHLDEDQVQSIHFDGKKEVKILGIYYETATDSFKYHFKPFFGIITRRSILSYISKIYDPLQFLAPLIFMAKSIFQACHKLDRVYDWNEELPAEIQKQWTEFTNSLNVIKEIQIPRCIPAIQCKLSLIGFSDASSKGYSAVLYLHCEMDGKQATCHLVRSKTKLAPIKPITIPKLELSGASLLAKLVVNTIEISHVQYHQVILYTDSQIVLHWLKKSPSSLERFVANRVCHINSLTQNWQWNYIPSQLNPSDLASRGLLGHKIIKNQMWWHGPEFLQKPVADWPHFPETSVVIAEEDVSQKLDHTCLLINEQDSFLYDFCCKFSSFSKLLRVMAFVGRFITNLKSKIKGGTQLTSGELLKAEEMIIRIAQSQHFSREIQQLQKGSACSGSLASLSPILQGGLLRVGGRITQANLSNQAKHPYILHKKCHITDILISMYHERFLHAGPTYLRAILRQKYWIISGQSAIKKIIRRCPKCLRFNGKPNQAQMGDLPMARVQLTRPFANTGLDFAGPFEIKASNLRKAPKQKGYICLFICLAVKAVHLEFVSGLSTEAFLAAFHRFIARRGLPQTVHADNGTNFVGAKNKLDLIRQSILKNSSDIQLSLAQRHVEWKFNPPYCPQFGGIWERAVRSVKAILVKNISEPLTHEEFSTLLCRVEAILNSRPLIPLSAATDDLNFLTPSHFLILQSPGTIVEEELSESSKFPCRWQRIQQVAQSIWKRFHKEYINYLIPRQKWKTNKSNVDVGDIVLVRNINCSPLTYPLGKIIKLHKGKDNIARVADVQIGEKIITRAINQLIQIVKKSV